jgi:predicted DNA-binding antitoxin AbrB/MazE fold protein
MVREIKARVSHGKIEPLEKLDLQEGDEVTILVKDTSPPARKSLFGLIPGTIIKGDIIAPLEDMEWEALE